MLDIFQIQPCPVAFSRFGCEAYIGDRVQGEQKPYLAISVCSGPFQSRCKSMIIIIWPFQFYIGESGVLPFLLLLPLLMVSGHLHLPSLRFSTFLSSKKDTNLTLHLPFSHPMCDPFNIFPGRPPCLQLHLCCVVLIKPKWRCSQGGIIIKV